MPAPAQRGEERTFLHQPTSAMQKHERRTIASLEDADPAATAGDIEQKRATAHGRISAVARPGTTRCRLGWEPQRRHRARDAGHFGDARAILGDQRTCDAVVCPGALDVVPNHRGAAGPSGPYRLVQ